VTQRPLPPDLLYDIAIVGGGATGLGAAVDAASRGHSVVLIEQSDFAKGTSSRSTKLAHGGVRYLKQGNLSLVLEALAERERLYRNAPGLVTPLPFVIPSFSPLDTPFYGIGLKLYDLLAGRANQHPSRLLSKQSVVERLPTLTRERLTGGVLYYDGQFDDTRLALALLLTAQDHGARLRNYLRCEGLLKQAGRVAGVRVTDTESGQTGELRAKCVINATGVFVDAVRQQDEPSAPRLLALSQGAHLVLPKAFLPGETALMIPKTADGRVLFAIPWHGATLLGTTDTPVPHATPEPRALSEEVEFLLRHAAQYLTKAPTPSDVLSVFAGLRPLVQQSGAKNTASLSRDHHIEVSEAGLVTITGGKWTTYRKMAEEVVSHAERVGALTPRPCRTTDLRLNESTGDLAWHLANTQTRTVEDYLARRTRALLLDARASADDAPRIAEAMAPALGWSQEETQCQVTRYQSLAKEYHL
jgi:glycerol-3-phosphate dehydrogenase